MSSKVSLNMFVLKHVKCFDGFIFNLFFYSFSPSPLCHCRAELCSSDSRYQAQRRITQLLQTELLQLYSRVEMEAPTSTATGSPPEGRAGPHGLLDSRSDSLGTPFGFSFA